MASELRKISPHVFILSFPLSKFFELQYLDKLYQTGLEAAYGHLSMSACESPKAYKLGLFPSSLCTYRKQQKARHGLETGLLNRPATIKPN